ncbi:MAG: trypsin-like peptidase domain-containing protein [Rhodospirillales bacterium]|nr:trypsin-like peptidase domain-containing protein [Rhodospirillales bacterium]MBT5673373.1 trypsin-like peptidase domain-containing protein [Rhodospirillales bacterium]MBT6186032.1 trypsin-like peptidase domain-containing protein [Rhodospirillales bacterium]MBT6742404.1 trypsin-like peptidase domain-containing protein [Rhodospirillales bacterium]
MNIKGDPHDLFKRKKSAQKAEYMIGANITKIASNICRETDVINGGRLNQFSGEFYVDVEWSILSTVTDQVVFKLKTQGYHKQVKQIRNGPLLMFQGAFSNAAQNLVTSAKFVTLAERKSDSAPARSFAGTGLKINFKPETDRPIKSKMAKVLSAVATVRIGGGHGSGFFISNDGYMLTNAHVVGDSKKVGVVLNNGIEVPARVIRKLKSRDIALIKVGLHVPNPLPIRHKPLTRLEQVYAIGTPIEEGLHSTISKGIVSGFRNFNGKKFIQSDTSISPGNSGGPLVDQNGNVVGVSVLKVVTPGAEGLGLFIPISNALSALKIKAK